MHIVYCVVGVSMFLYRREKQHPVMSGYRGNGKQDQAIEAIRKGFNDKAISERSMAKDKFRTFQIFRKAYPCLKSFGPAFYRDRKRFPEGNFESESGTE